MSVNVQVYCTVLYCIFVVYSNLTFVDVFGYEDEHKVCLYELFFMNYKKYTIVELKLAEEIIDINCKWDTCTI